MHGHRLPLQNLLEAMERVDAFIEGLDFRTFQRDEQVSRALAEHLETIGERARHLPEEIRKKYAHVPWKVLDDIQWGWHGGSSVDYERIWRLVTEQLPRIKRALEDILGNLR